VSDPPAASAGGTPAPAPPPAQTLRPGAVQATATAFASLFCVVGLALYGLPFYYDFMVRQFGWTRGEVTSGNALSKLVIGPAFGFLAGWLVDRFGPRRLMMAGILMAGIALVGLGRVNTLGAFYFFYMFNALGYVCGGPLPAQVLISRWFDKARGKAMGIAYLGIGLGGALVPLLSAALVERYGWRAALETIGVLVVIVAFPLAYFVKEAPGPSRAGPALAPRSSLAAFKSGSFYLLTIGSMCSIGALAGVQQNLKLFLSVDQHFSQSQAARILSLVLASSIAGRLLMGWLADRIPTKYVMLLIYFLLAGAIPLLFLGQWPPAIYLFAAIFGIGIGGDYMVIPLMTAEIFGVEVLGRLMGVILTATGIAEAASPWMIGRLRDVRGSYSVGFLVLVGLTLAGAVAIAALPNPRRTA
jgi:sugar phosphate permease